MAGSGSGGGDDDGGGRKEPLFSRCFQTQKTPQEEEEEKQARRRYQETVAAFPMKVQPWSPVPLREYGGFNILEPILVAILAVREHFKPRPDDVLLVTNPKCGTTWLKALVFAIVNRHHIPLPPPSSSPSPSPEILQQKQHPLLVLSPHQCIPFLEGLFMTAADSFPDLDALPAPRVLATHIPFSLFFSGDVDDGDIVPPCRIVYMSRDPKDVLVSMFDFLRKVSGNADVSLEDAFDVLTDGRSPMGPIWEHQLEYWHESLRWPEKVLFLRYEELKREEEDAMIGGGLTNIRRLAAFLGFPFSAAEEEAGVAERISRLCSFESLSKLEANKDGELVDMKVEGHTLNNSFYFRKGKVGDWEEKLTADMARRLDDITADRFRGSGLVP